MLFNLDFANTILSCFFFFFVTELNFLIAAVIIVQFFNTIAELVIPKGITTKKAKSEIEIHTVIVEAKSVQNNLELYKSFCAFH